MIQYKFIKSQGKIDGLEHILSRLPIRLKQLMNGEYVLTVKKVCKNRTLNQNNLYWKWVEIIASETGYTKDEAHDALKQKFLTPEFKEVFGEKITVEISTKNMTTQQFVSYMEQIEAWALTELGITLPLPEDIE